jgi:hypothetical protein
MKQILFIGSNPSIRAIDTTPFHQSTKSGRVLSSWIDFLQPIDDIKFLNISDKPTENNRPLTQSEMMTYIQNMRSILVDYYIKGYKIIALGRTAANALQVLQISHFQATHPSPRNRKLNDSTFIQTMLRAMKAYIQ